MYVTEDTTRADPETLRRLYSTAIRAGATRVCIADTVGHATPAGAAAVVRFVAQVVEECGGGVGIDWHGHRDRDFAVINSLAALEAGATRLHGAAIGIGERVGNTPMDMLLVNLVLMGYIERDLSALVEYCETVSAATGVPIPPNYPVVGRDAFRTATGVHAAAVIKAFRKKDHALVDAVYSGVPASLVGREQEIEVGPMSGKSNVVFWLEKRGLPATDEIVDRIFAKAKASATVLGRDEIRGLATQPTTATVLHRGLEQPLLDRRQRRQQDVADRLQRCGRDLVERVVGGVPGGVVEVDDVDRRDAGLEELAGGRPRSASRVDELAAASRLSPRAQMMSVSHGVEFGSRVIRRSRSPIMSTRMSARIVLQRAGLACAAST